MNQSLFRHIRALPMVFILICLSGWVATVSALECLSDTDMKQVIGQSGITLYVDDAVVYYQASSIKVTALDSYDRFGDDLDVDGYLAASVEALLIIEGGLTIDVGGYADETLTVIDTWDNGTQSAERTLDHPMNGTALVAISFADWSIDGALDFSDIRTYDHDIDGDGTADEVTLGSLSVGTLSGLTGYLELFTGLTTPCGIGFNSGFTFQIEDLTYTDTEGAQNLLISGITFCGSFTGTDLPNYTSGDNTDDDDYTTSITTDWTADEDDSYFQIGIASLYTDDPDAEDLTAEAYSASINFVVDTDRTTDYPTDYAAYVELNLPMQGSIRIESLQGADGVDLGTIAIDGMRVYKNYIEFPGRGLGGS